MSAPANHNKLPEGEHWFCIQTKPKSEHIAAAHLKLLEGVEVFCPRIKFRRTLRRGKVWFNEALFPCYIFARYDAQENFRGVNYATAVSKILHFGEQVVIVPDEVIEMLRAEVGEEELVEVDPRVEVGDEVVVSEGPMLGLSGIVTQLRSGKERVQILIEFLGRDTLAEVKAEKMSTDASPRELMHRRPESRAEGVG